MSLSLSDIIFIFFMFLIPLLFIRDMIRGKGYWRINLKARNCPNCRKKLPFPRFPTSFFQLWSGARNCPQCGCEMDIWGKKT